MVIHINKPKISLYIASFYFFILIILFILWTQISLLISKIILFIILVTISYHIIWIFNTRYIINNGILEIHSLYGIKRIKLSKIKHIEKVEVPSFLKFVGSSFYTGYYNIKDVGRCFLAITNFYDSILIKDDNNYIITPRNPDAFMKLLKK